MKQAPSTLELSGLGIEFASIFVSTVLLGNYLQNKFDFSPWGVMIGAALGFTASLYHVIKRSKEISKRLNEK